MCEIISIKEEKQYYDKYIVKVKESNIHKSENTKLIIYVKKQNEFSLGDIVYFKGDFSKGSASRNYRGFNYRNYLKQSKIYGIVKVESINKIDETIDLFILINKVRQMAYNKIEELYDGNSVGFLKGILLGYTGDIDDNIKENFNDSNISHILAISGIHVSYIIFGIDIILKKLIYSKRSKDIIKICILVFFAVITGLSASCVRACIMCSMIIIGSMANRKNNFYISMSISLTIILIYNPYNLNNVGMWLSFAGTLSIYIFNKFLTSIIKLKFKKINIVTRQLLNICILSISANILIIPIILYSFSTISLTFFVSNTLIHYLTGPIMAIGYISVFTGFISFKLGKFLSIFEMFLINIFIKIAKICSYIPFSKIYLKTPNLITILAYYLIIFLIVRCVNKNKLAFFRLVLRKRVFKRIH